MIRIGDVVRFITDKLEGKVTSIVNKEVVNVYCDDYGFEIPASVSDLVVIKSDFKEETVTKSNSSNQKSVDVERTNRVYLAITPSNMSNLLNAQFELALINDTNYTVLYAVSYQNENKTYGISAGNCDAENKVVITNYSLKEIDSKIKSLNIQVIYYAKGVFVPRETLTTTLKLNSVNLCKSGSYKHSRWFRDLTQLRMLDEANTISHEEIDEKALSEAIAAKQDRVVRIQVQEEEPKKVNKNILEVDLHIDALLEDTTGMNNADILEHQLDIFRDTLQKYKLRTGQKIVFIHGKGDGVLRQRILWELQTKYKRFNHQDASFKQYGYGATMVTIK